MGVDPAPDDLARSPHVDPPAATGFSREHATLIARTLKVLANPTRLQLLSTMLHAEGGQASVKLLTSAVDLRQPTVSQHLQLMHEAGLVERQPRGREVLYSIHPDMVATITDLVD